MRDEMAPMIQGWLIGGTRVALRKRIAYVVQLDRERGLEKKAG